MKQRQTPRGVLKLVGVVAFVAALPPGSGAQTTPAADPDVPQVPVYIGDFELNAAGPAPSGSRSVRAPAKKPDTNPSPVAGSPASSPVVFLESDPPNVQAQKLVDFFSLTLEQMLQKNGYIAKRQRGSRPDNGVMFRGIFAEVDPMNRVRKAILGSPSTNTKFALYVGTCNLARPDQPLYQLAVVQDPDNRFGPVVTLNAYIPMARYELDRDPTEDDVRKICDQIVKGLSELLKKNPAAFWK